MTDDQKTGYQPMPDTLKTPGIPSGGKDPYGPDVGFRRLGTDFPGQNYVEVDDIILWSSWSFVGAQPMTLSMKILRADGVIVPYFQSGTSGPSAITPQTTRLTVPAGFILSCTITSVNVARGETYSKVEIIRGLGSGDGTFGQLICSGYPNRFNPVSFPNLPNEPADSGFGAITHVAVTTPAAGADWAFTWPSGFHARIIGVRAILTTSAAVANRIPRLQITDGVNIAASIPVQAPVTASQVADLNWHGGNSGVALAGPPVVQSMGLPGWARCFAGFIVQSSTGNIQAADQWSAIVIYSELWSGL